MLDGQHVDLIDVQEARRPAVRAQVALCNLKPYTRRIWMPSAGIVHRDHERVDVREICRQRIGKVGRERGDTALTRQVIAKDCEPVHFGGVAIIDVGEPTGDGCSLLNSRGVEKPPACVMQTEIVAAGKARPSTADERWAAWVAGGVEHDRKAKKRAIASAAAIAGGLGLWLAISLLFG